MNRKLVKRKRQLEEDNELKERCVEKGKPDAYEPGCPNEPSTNRRKRIRRVNTALSKLEKENELTEGAVLGGRKTRCVRAMLSQRAVHES